MTQKPLARSMTHDNRLLAQIAELQTLPVKQIKKLWLDLYRTEPPEYNRPFLISRLTYRLQELAYGGDDLTEQRLDAMVRVTRLRTGKGVGKAQIHRPIAGTRLVREYRGVEYQVTVENDGFVFNGRKYKSLSRIAQIITGTTWSGPTFFGLSERKAKS